MLVNEPNDAGFAQVEPAIAGDPNDVNHLRLAAGAIDYNTSQGTPYPAFYASTDGGSTWPLRGLIPGLSGVTYPSGGDPALAFDQGGRVYYSGTGFNMGGCAGTSAIFVARSPDGGQSYDNAVLVASASDGTQVLHDKPWIAVDRTTGNVYVTWTRYTGVGGVGCAYGQIWEAVSTNHGGSFDAGRQVSTDPLYPVSTGSNVAVGTDGVVNVVWLAGNRVIKLARCTNGGTTCGAEQPITQITPLPLYLPGMQFRVNSFPMLAVDGVATNGYLTIAWADYRSGIGQIYSSISTDNGTTWTAPLAVAPTSTDQFFPAISVDSTHLQRIVYYQRTSQSANTFNLFFVTGNGRGNFSTPTQVNDGGDISGYGFPGDYIGIASPYYNHPVWTDSRRGNHDIYTATVSGC